MSSPYYVARHQIMGPLRRSGWWEVSTVARSLARLVSLSVKYCASSAALSNQVARS